jgi:hypothetical protein
MRGERSYEYSHNKININSENSSISIIYKLIWEILFFYEVIFFFFGPNFNLLGLCTLAWVLEL